MRIKVFVMIITLLEVAANAGQQADTCDNILKYLRHNKTDTYINNPSVKHQSVVESPSDSVLRRINVCVSDGATCDKKKIKRQIPTYRAGGSHSYQTHV